MYKICGCFYFPSAVDGDVIYCVLLLLVYLILASKEEAEEVGGDQALPPALTHSTGHDDDVFAFAWNETRPDFVHKQINDSFFSPFFFFLCFVYFCLCEFIGLATTTTTTLTR